MLRFDQTYVLENEVVRLEPLQLTHAEHLLPFSLHQPEIWKYSLVQAIGEKGLENYLQLAVQGREQKKEYPFAVWDKRTARYAGSTRFYDIQPESKCLQLGYTWYGKEFQGTGLNKNCKYLLLSVAFDTLGMERVEFRADNRNERSIAAMKSIGCRVEGVLRSNGYTPEGTRRDSIVLSILKAEWDKEVKNTLLSKL